MTNKTTSPRRRASTEIACCVALVLAQSAWAQQQRFDVPESDAVSAIPEFARQAGLQIVAPADELRGVRTAALRGELDTREALKRLLQGTGLEIASDDGALITLRKAGASDSLRISTLSQAGGTSDAGSEDALEEVVVRGIEFRYSAPSTATKLPMDPKDIPQSVTMVTEDVMDFASIRRFDDIYRVDASSGSTFRQDGFPTAYFRGFSNQGVNAIRIDGFRFVGNIDLDLVGFDRFEVVKGPSSALFGQNTIGGTLNAVTKQPQAARGGSLRVEGGSHDLRRGELDLTGPIDADGRWQYRIIGAYEDADSFLDFAGRKSTTIVPSLSFELSEQTRFLLSGYYNKQDAVTDWGHGLQKVDADNGVYRLLPVPRSHFFGEPWNHTDAEAFIVTLKMEHEFNDAWSLRMAVQRNGNEKTRLNCVNDGNAEPDGVVYPGCFTYLSEQDSPLQSGEVDLVGKFDAWGRQHTLLLGVDYAEQDSSSLYGFDIIDDSGQGLASGSGLGYNILNPVRIPRVGREDLFFYTDTLNTTIYSGLTAQLLLHANDRLALLLAGRYNKDRVSRYEEKAAGSLEELQASSFAANPSGIFDQEKFVGQAGVTYSVTAATNLYVNWGQTYEPNFGRRGGPDEPSGGRQLPSEDGEQLELGFKTSVFDGRLGLTFAAFTMERSGILEDDRVNLGFSLPVGSQRSRGVELGASGQLLPGWEIYASAAFMDAEFIEGEFTGEHAANAPKQALSVFTSYQVQAGPAQGLGVGLGYVHKSGLDTYGRVFGHDPIRFDFGTINEIDLRLFYNAQKWEAYLAARNLLDEVSHAPSFFNELRWGISVNPGRTITAGLTYKPF